MIDLKRLSEPFPPEDIEWFIGVTTKDKTKGLAIPFITNRAVMDRLDEVCGVDGWKNEYRVLKERAITDRNGEVTGTASSQLCGISVWSEERHEWITKWDGAEDSDIEAIKGGLSSAMKRAAVQFGIGRYLYKLDNPWVPIEEKGRTYEMSAACRINLPAWALPGGSGRPDGQSRKAWVEYINPDTAPQQNNYNNQTEQQQNNNRTTTDQQQNNSSNAPQQSQGSSYKLTAKQIDRAYKKASAANLSMDDVTLWISKKFGIQDISLLNRKQYDELCNKMDEFRMKGEQ